MNSNMLNILFYIWEDETYVRIDKYNTATFNNVFHLKNFPFDAQSFPFSPYILQKYKNDIILVFLVSSRTWVQNMT